MLKTILEKIDKMCEQMRNFSRKMKTILKSQIKIKK